MTWSNPSLRERCATANALDQDDEISGRSGEVVGKKDSASVAVVGDAARCFWTNGEAAPL